MRVTAKNLFNLPNGTHTVSQNLYVRMKEGRGYYIFRYTIDGKRKDMSLGSIKKIALKDAKLKADELRLKLANDQPLKEEKKVEAQVETVESYGRRVLDIMFTVQHHKSGGVERDTRYVCRQYVFPAIGKVEITKVTRTEVLKVLEGIWVTKHPTAYRVLSAMRKIFSYAVVEGLLPFNPALWQGNLELFLPTVSKTRTVRHHPAATVEQTQTLVQGRITCVAQAAIVFCAMTASRKTEVAHAKWEEFDFETATWYVPPERRKDCKPYPHRVPLSKQVMELLQSFPRINEYVFPSDRRLGRPLNTAAITTKICQRNCGYTVHGFRSTFRDWCAENGVPDTVAEKSLMHSTGNAVVQAYQRSDLLELRRPVMQKWAEVLCGTASPRLVLPATHLIVRLSKSPDPSDNAEREELLP